MAFSNGSKTEASLSEINVTPFVDVMLVLLIIFMITAPMIQRGVDVAVPKARSGNVIPEERLVITITKSNELYLTGRTDQIGVDQLPDEIKRYYGEKGVAEADRTIYVRADEEVSYANLMLVIDQAKTAGVKAVGLVTDPKPVQEKADGSKAP